MMLQWGRSFFEEVRAVPEEVQTKKDGWDGFGGLGDWEEFGNESRSSTLFFISLTRAH